MIVPLVALLASVIAGIIALVVDLSRQEIAAQNIQRSADAAALAAVRRLNGRLDGWWDAKKAAFITFRSNPIMGVPREDIANIKLEDGDLAYWDEAGNITDSYKTGTAGHQPPGRHAGTTGAAGVLRVQIERGLYWKDPDDGGRYRFVSLEKDADGLKGAVPYYILANSVRVQVTVDRLDTYFGRIYEYDSFENLSRQAVAIVDSALEMPVAPIGIPLCQLLFNTNPTTIDGNHFAPVYQGSMQCERAAFAAEANAKGDLATSLDLSESKQDPHILTAKDRVDGLVRSESFERQAYFRHFREDQPNLCFRDPFNGGAINCKALPLYATLGVPASKPGEEATAEEVVSAMTSAPVATLGGNFKPLMSLRGMSESGMMDRMASAINSSPRTIRDVFLPSGRPAPNFPFLRTTHVNPEDADPQRRPTIGGDYPEYYDRNISIPSPAVASKNRNEVKFLMSDMAALPGVLRTEPQLNYTNPMCHVDRIYHNDPDEGRVYEAYAMVLAPGIEEFNGDIVRYCDFANVFVGNGESYGSDEQDAVAPVAESHPTIVGFVKLNVFDLNFELLDTREEGVTDKRNPSVRQTKSTPVYLNGNGALWDGNPWGLNLYGSKWHTDMWNNANEFEQEFKKVKACQAEPNCTMVQPQFNAAPYEVPNNLRECFDFSEFDQKVKVMKQLAPGRDPLESLHDLTHILDAPIPAKPDIHCLPRLKDGFFNKNDADAYEPLRDLKPGVGCGALRARLDCGGAETLIPTGRDHSRSNPTLISADAIAS